MIDNDTRQSTRFDFFKKRKRTSRGRRDHHGEGPGTRYHMMCEAVSEKGAPLSNSASGADPHGNGRRRGASRGILVDDNRDKSQSQSESNAQAEEYYAPDQPNVDYQLCKAFNYVIWARDQMVFGNEEILSHPNLEQEFLRQLETLGKMIHKKRGDLSSSMKILESVLELMVDVNIGYRYLASNAPSFCRLSQVYINGFIFLRAVSLGTFNFVTPDEEASVTIRRNKISGNVFAHHQLMEHFSKQCEYLPSKFSADYMYKNVAIENDYVPNLVTKVILQQAKRQLVVVKAMMDVPGMDLAPYEGYVLDDLKTGEKAWLPIYMVERLSHYGFVSVDLPMYLTRRSLRNLRSKEEESQTLEKLPNDYFFEVAYLFTHCHLFETINVPNLSDRNNVYNYISKVAGIIEDIKYQRIKKIRQTLEKMAMDDLIIFIENLQFSETYYINQFLSAYCDISDNIKRSELQPNTQIGHLVVDLENNLIDSMKAPLL
ncbi:hypothetical protein BgAZ_102200 [Babesia gibsoni]|uniref:GINS subunit domain-containing protein n=1 Tax=Babesia gibsoni TaxID=33632 RepID=A0AAD8UVF5_BABGI|nr:hypothetical protein BgAZ_102200 [Babesia gibsoni]